MSNNPEDYFLAFVSDPARVKSEVEEWAEKAETVLWEIRNMSASLFTAGELMYVQHWTSKVRWGGPVEREKHLFEEWSNLKVDLQSRAVLIGDPLGVILKLKSTEAERDEKSRMIDAMYAVVNGLPDHMKSAVWEALQNAAS